MSSVIWLVDCTLGPASALTGAFWPSAKHCLFMLASQLSGARALHARLARGKLAELLTVALAAATRLNNALSHSVFPSILLTAQQSAGFPPPPSPLFITRASNCSKAAPFGSELERRSRGSDCGAEVAGPATPVGNTSCEVGTWPWKRGEGEKYAFDVTRR